MQAFAGYLSHRGYLKRKISIKEARLEKYVASRDPLKPLERIGDISELLPFDWVHLYVVLESNGREEAFFGNFYVDEDGRLVPEGYDDDELDVYPEELTEKVKLSDKVLEKLKEYKEEIWEIVTFIANLVIEFMRARTRL